MQNLDPAPVKPPVFLTVSEAAKLLKICDRTLYDLIRHNMGPRVIPIGTRNKRILYADFQDWIADPPTRPRPRRKQRGRK